VRWILLLLLLPVLELYVLLRLGEAIGALYTMGILLVGAFAGVWLAKSEGLRVLRRWREAMEDGRVPEEGLTDGFLVLLGGGLLLLPGVVSDGLGVILLLPPMRRWIARRIRRGVEAKMKEGSIHVVSLDLGGATRPREHEEALDLLHDGREVIDVEGVAVEEPITRHDRLLAAPGELSPREPSSPPSSRPPDRR
jgi:UPF0716 family protein affecting phage T7 exclusion